MIDIIQEIYGTIKRNKLRTALTGFAVAWGIFILIVLLGAGNGILNAFEQQSGNMAMNSFQIWPAQTSIPYQGMKEGRNIKLTEKELELTRQMTDHVTHASAILQQGGVNLSYKQDHLSLQLTGVMPNYPETNGLQLKKGRFICMKRLQKCSSVTSNQKLSANTSMPAVSLIKLSVSTPHLWRNFLLQLISPTQLYNLYIIKVTESVHWYS